MHHYPEDQSKENLAKIRRVSVCSVCGRQVAIFIDLRDKRRYIACSGQVHEGITREYKPPAEDYESNIRRSMELENKVGTEVARRIGNIPMQGQLTQPEATTVLNLIYPNATKVEIERCAIFCRDFGLHPLANEVYLIPFKGKNVMVVGIAANRKMAHNLKGDFSFLDDTPRSATEEEIVKQYGKDSEEAENNIISITKLQGVRGNLAVGFGLYSKKESPYGMDKGNTRRNQANIRSERQGIDRLPGKVMPHIEVVDEAYVEGKVVAVDGVGKVETATGLIEEEAKVVEGVVKEIPPEGKVEPGDDLFGEKPPVAGDKDRVLDTEEQTELVDLTQANNMGGTDLLKWCNAEPRKWGIKVFRTDLKLWQFEEIKVAFQKGEA